MSLATPTKDKELLWRILACLFFVILIGTGWYSFARINAISKEREEARLAADELRIKVNKSIQERNIAVSDKNKAEQERDAAQSAQRRAEAERDIAVSDKKKAEQERDNVLSAQPRAETGSHIASANVIPPIQKSRILSDNWFEEIHPIQDKYNIRMGTQGGDFWWTTMDSYHGWRLQKNYWTGHYRILDPASYRCAWGSKSKMTESFNDVKRQIDNLLAQ